MSTKYPGGFITKDYVAPTTSSAPGIWTLDQQMQAQKAGIWPDATVYIENVFSTYVYTGTGSAQTITNNIDLSTKGGLVWVKSRSVASSNLLSSNPPYRISTNSTAAESSQPTQISAFTTSGFSVGTDSAANGNGQFFASWTFRKQPKFFDVVTYTGTGVARTIAHNLGSVPGCIITKRTDSTSDWQVYHRSLGNTNYVQLNATGAVLSGPTQWNSTDPTSTVFSLGTGTQVNAAGGTFVAYLFAHDAGGFGLTGTDNVISCGSYTGTAATLQVTLGYEPQWLLIKNASTAGYNWYLYDTTRGLPFNFSGLSLYPNTTDVEATTFSVYPTSTGFTVDSAAPEVNQSGSTFIYIAIRRGSMKIPTTGTSVFQPVAYTGTNVDNRLVNTGIFTDLAMSRIRSTTSAGGFYTANRTQGNYFIQTAATTGNTIDADSYMTPTVGYGLSFSAMNGFGVGNDLTRQLNQNGTNQLTYAFQRATGFFDIVNYVGTGVAKTVTHNLGVTPELMILKCTSATDAWRVYYGVNTNFLEFNYSTATQVGSGIWNNTSPTSSVFTIGSNGTVNTLNATYVNFLFATLPGVSKVGTYSGTGATQTIACGFTGGARFVLIKAITTAQDWYVWDTARGMVAGTDLSLQPNTTNAEANANNVYTTSGGFQIVGTGANVNSVGNTYVYLAIA